MKKLYSLTALILLACLLCGCGAGGTKAPEMQTVADAVGGAVELSDMTQLPDSYVTDVMGIALDGYESRNTLISAIGTNINEYGIFLGKDEAQAEALEEALEAYLDYREELWMDEYLPNEKPKLDNAEVWSEGNFVMYAILDDESREAVHKAFEGCFGD